MGSQEKERERKDFWQIPGPLAELSIETGILSVIGEGKTNQTFFLTVWPHHATVPVKLEEGDKFLKRLEKDRASFLSSIHTAEQILQRAKPYSSSSSTPDPPRWRRPRGGVGEDEVELAESSLARFKGLYELYGVLLEAIFLGMAFMETRGENDKCQELMENYKKASDEERKRICDIDPKCSYFINSEMGITTKLFRWIQSTILRRKTPKGGCFGVKYLQAQLKKAEKENKQTLFYLVEKSKLEDKRLRGEGLSLKEKQSLHKANTVVEPVLKVIQEEEDTFVQIAEITRALQELESRVAVCKQNLNGCTENLDAIGAEITRLQKQRKSLVTPKWLKKFFVAAKWIGIAGAVVLVVIVLMGVFNVLFPGVTLASAATSIGSAAASGLQAIGSGLASAGSATLTGIKTLGSAGIGASKILGSAALTAGKYAATGALTGAKFAGSTALSAAGLIGTGIKNLPSASYQIGTGIGTVAKGIVKTALAYPTLMFSICSFNTFASTISGWILKYLPAAIAVVVAPLLVKPADWMTVLCSGYTAAKFAGA